jgi:hypothetical protein
MCFLISQETCNAYVEAEDIANVLLSVRKVTSFRLRTLGKLAARNVVASA